MLERFRLYLTSSSSFFNFFYFIRSNGFIALLVSWLWLCFFLSLGDFLGSVMFTSNKLHDNTVRVPWAEEGWSSNKNSSYLTSLASSKGVSTVAKGLRVFTGKQQVRHGDGDHLNGVYGLDEHNEPLWKPFALQGNMTYEEKVRAHTGYCFNSRVSDSLPLDRAVPDFRHELCSRYQSITTLPKVTVIFVFHNELFSVLLRSIHSVLNRSPAELLEQIILVNDNSNAETHFWLYKPLENYIATLPKITLFHLPTRLGLMGARTFGARQATSEVLVFLDSHIEATKGWLEPLLDLIHENRKTVVTPIIHTIDADTFEFQPTGLEAITFSWTLGQKFMPPGPRDKPFNSPVMAGGLFAIDRSWFHDIGEYDKELQLYGGEEFEIGFKTWMCGGKLVVQPCSRVGHVFRTSDYWKHQVYKVPGSYIQRNKLRVAEAWMDEYGDIVKMAMYPASETLIVGSVDEARQIRQRLKCHSFKWFMEHLDVRSKDPFRFPGSVLGYIRNNASSLCFDTYQELSANKPVSVYPCHYKFGSQLYVYQANGIIYSIHDTDLCITNHASNVKSLVYSSQCTPQSWRFNNKTFSFHFLPLPDHCLQLTWNFTRYDMSRLTLERCDGNVYQMFELVQAQLPSQL